MKFTATDGTVFTDRNKYRKYEMETQYTVRNKTDQTVLKPPKSIQGQPFDIIDCHNCTIKIVDRTDQVQIDNVTSSRIFVGASSGSIFVRNCRDCTFTVACKQLRTRDCHNCTFYLYCKTEPVIETSVDMRFAPFNGDYPGHETDMTNADLDAGRNLWDVVFDFTPPAKKLLGHVVNKNWRRLLSEEREGVWYPLRQQQTRDDGECSMMWSPLQLKLKDAEALVCDVHNDDDDDDDDGSEENQMRRSSRRPSLLSLESFRRLRTWKNFTKFWNPLRHKVVNIFGLFCRKFPLAFRTMTRTDTGRMTPNPPSHNVGWRGTKARNDDK
mmetsp:Transcript_12145/g.15147  ORF Transcript_12145/g.15147 Transcript_12145/m.15147 type:complete len:326 (+) Transcript_12145:107-1084(+)